MSQVMTPSDAYRLLDEPLDRLVRRAGDLRDEGHGNVVTWSPKVFIPLTQLCRDVCHYCTFAKAPRRVDQAYLSIDQVLAIARAGADAGCTEALFTLGDRPEVRYAAARGALAALGHDSTLSYLREVAGAVMSRTGLLPHINAGVMDAEAFAALRPVSASMGLMLESTSPRLCERGGPHFGSPDKRPAIRLETVREAGRARVPFTTGLLIGIGETRAERIDTLLAIARLQDEHGHIQEVIVQNFRAKHGTRMAGHAEPDLDDLRWTIAVARLILGPEMSVQAPPNLSDLQSLPALIEAGINDWGGVSPVTPDHVNPEAAWPDRDRLAEATAMAGKTLVPRLTIYPRFARDLATWSDGNAEPAIRALADSEGLGRDQAWFAGAVNEPPPASHRSTPARSRVASILRASRAGERFAEAEIETLLEARGADLSMIVDVADQLRRDRCGDTVTYVVNRNINYTNICSYRCGFCAFSKGKTHEELRGPAYQMDLAEVADRVAEARARGATEVCMQGGIHPKFTGETYVSLCAAARAAAPDMHIHAFSPLEVLHGARSLGMSIEGFLRILKEAGLNSLPGTAAEVLDDEVRAIICPDKLMTAEWVEVIETAHAVGLPTTSTIMFGHVEEPRHVARHLRVLADLQGRTGGITEFVPLPFVHMEAPMYLKGRARRGPTWREVQLVHSVARIVFDGLIDNIQASWVKLGPAGAQAALAFGVNDLGGTLMNESITRAAGAAHGQEVDEPRMRALIAAAGKTPQRRNTLYAAAASSWTSAVA
jgi:FO synthase